MKKIGFTLAEILVTLSIIGVVAAMTLPGLITRANDQANASKLGACVNAIENAFGMMITKEDVDGLDKTNFWNNQTDTNFKKYLSVTSTTDTMSNYSGSAKFQLKNGANIGIDTTNKKLYIDVNGTNKPNKTDKDLFSFDFENIDGSLTGKLTPQDTAATLAKNNYKIQ